MTHKRSLIPYALFFLLAAILPAPAPPNPKLVSLCAKWEKTHDPLIGDEIQELYQREGGNLKECLYAVQTQP